ncbi:MAG: ECF-type sigma factor [Holophagales bacterium]|nr:ECF-type sigma factor [Holophagales bacterium]
MTKKQGERSLEPSAAPGDLEQPPDAAAPDPAVASELAAELYDELRALARSFLARERRDHTLQPTALVHEAYMRLDRQTRVAWKGRTHFFAVGATVMRRVLIDHARRGLRPRHGGDRQRVSFDGSLEVLPEANLAIDELLALNDAIEELSKLDGRAARVVELRFFAGLAMGEIASHLGVSKRTVEEDWSHARAWLAAVLAEPRAEEGPAAPAEDVTDSP